MSSKDLGKIDAVDDQIVELLAERAGYVKEVEKEKGCKIAGISS